MVWGVVTGVAAALVVLWAVAAWRRGRYARRGRRGERVVARELSRLGGREYIVLNDLLLPGAGGASSQIDHLVVSTRGIFIIETKSHAGRISGSENGQYWQQHLSEVTKTFYNPLLQNRSHLRAVRRVLKGHDGLGDDAFATMAVFTDAWRLDIKADDLVIERTLLPDRHIRRTVVPAERRPRRWWRPWGGRVELDESKMATLLPGMNAELKRRPRIIAREALRDIAGALLEANINGRAARREHTDYARRTSAAVTADIRAGRCPRCGRELTVRRSGGAEFAGCTGYPDCRFTCPIDRLRH